MFEQLGLNLGDGLGILLRRYYLLLLGAAFLDGVEQVGVDIAFDIALPEVEEILVGLALLVTAINDTTREEIRAIVAQAKREGWSADRTADELLARGVTRSAVRARSIAITEGARASSMGSLLYYERSGVVEEIEWLTFDPCPVCEPLDGKHVELGREFAPGIFYPPVHPLCRCAILPVVR